MGRVEMELVYIRVSRLSVEEIEFAKAVFRTLCLGLWISPAPFPSADNSSGDEIFRFCQLQYGVAHLNTSWQFGVEEMPTHSADIYFTLLS